MKKFSLLIFATGFFLGSCATTEKEFDRVLVKDTKEFNQVVKVEKIETEQVKTPEESTSAQKTKKARKTEKPKLAHVKKVSPKTEKKPEAKQAKSQQVMKKPPKRQPPMEDDEGFYGRRPVVEPYKVGEEIVLGISYFGVEAGKFTMQVMPMVEVNGSKSYHFRYLIKTSPLFAMFYRVDDVAETFVDYENLLPHSYEIHVDESKQVRETRTYFDHKKLHATMWDRKQRKGKELEKRKIEWTLNEYSQNVFSSAYYLRNFTLRVGKKLKVNVGHEGKNIVMSAEVIRKETLYTDVGKFETFVVKPTFNIEGKFKPVGENYLWLTADDRKFIVRVESKIKIGTIVGEVQKLKK